MLVAIMVLCCCVHAPLDPYYLYRNYPNSAGHRASGVSVLLSHASLFKNSVLLYQGAATAGSAVDHLNLSFVSLID